MSNHINEALKEVRALRGQYNIKRRYAEDKEEELICEGIVWTLDRAIESLEEYGEEMTE